MSELGKEELSKAACAHMGVCGVCVCPYMRIYQCSPL